jgi:hypothetical protein
VRLLRLLLRLHHDIAVFPQIELGRSNPARPIDDPRFLASGFSFEA